MTKHVLYRALYFCVFCFYFPYLLCKRAVQGKSIRSLFEHLFPQEIHLEKTGPVIWAHAVSVGEVVAISPILSELFRQKENVQIILSTVTETGFETAKKMVPRAVHVKFPFDFPYCVKKILGDISPSLVLLSEGDVWPVFLEEMKQRKAQIVLINGKMSDRTFSWFQKFPSVGTWLYKDIDHFCVQNVHMKKRWEYLKIRPERIHVTGNTKTDTPPRALSQEELDKLRSKLCIQESDHVVVLGSTHYPEEEKIITTLGPLLKTDPALKIIVVPRHPGRACEVCEILQRKAAPDPVELLSSGKKEWRILVVDELGVLTSLYQIATVAVVCGSFSERIGGHNIFESAIFGVPTIVGPYMHSQRTLFESALKNMAVIQIGYNDVRIVIGELLRNEEVHSECALKAKTWADSLRGATDKTVQVVLGIEQK